jgi:hypothetical protein
VSAHRRPLLFERQAGERMPRWWRGCWPERQFGFAVERAVFLTGCIASWCGLRPCAALARRLSHRRHRRTRSHIIHRAMAGGEELPGAELAACTRPRCVKDLIEGSCLPGAPCSASSPWCSWTPRRVLASRAAAAAALGRAAIARITGRTSTRWWRHHHGSERPASVLGDVAGQHRRRSPRSFR